MQITIFCVVYLAFAFLMGLVINMRSNRINLRIRDFVFGLFWPIVLILMFFELIFVFYEDIKEEFKDIRW